MGPTHPGRDTQSPRDRRADISVNSVELGTGSVYRCNRPRPNCCT